MRYGKITSPQCATTTASASLAAQATPIIGTIVGAIVAVSLAITSVGSIVATLKTFLIVGLIAMAVIIIVWLVARRPRSAVRRD